MSIKKNFLIINALAKLSKITYLRSNPSPVDFKRFSDDEL